MLFFKVPLGRARSRHCSKEESLILIIDTIMHYNRINHCNDVETKVL
jgi:hypothetical protein